MRCVNENENETYCDVLSEEDEATGPKSAEVDMQGHKVISHHFPSG